MNTKRPYLKNKTSILALCQELHMSMNGSSEPFAKDALTEASLFLSTVLKHWKDRAARHWQYDDAVKDLIVSTLHEVIHLECEEDL